MKLSIFRAAKAIPSDKGEKRTEAFKTSEPYLPEVMEIKNDEDLINTVTNFVWSPSIFDGPRKAENFLSADFMALDIDTGLKIEEAESRVQKANICCLCLPSPNHSPEAHRFRLIFPLAKTIFTQEVFDSTWEWLSKLFPELDRSCSDNSRFYFGSTIIDGFWQSGDLLIPQAPVEKEKSRYVITGKNIDVGSDLESMVEFIYGQKRRKIPECVDHFIRNANTGLKGEWISSLNSFVFVLSLTGIEDSIIMSVCEKLAPEPLDSKDLYQINRSIRDGIKQRKNEGKEWKSSLISQK